MKKIIFIVLSLMILILVMGAIGLWQASNWEEKIKEGSFPQLESIPLPQQKQPQEFISPDQRLKVEYPGGYFAIEDQEILKNITYPQWEEYEPETLLLAQKFESDGFAQLLIQKGNFETSIEEIIGIMQAGHEEQGREVEVLEQDIKGNEGIFEARYQLPENYTLHSREKILLSEDNKTYLIAFITSEENWQSLAPEADSIISSARLLTEFSE